MDAGVEKYRLGPFVIASELPFPELTREESGEPDFSIRMGTAPERIEGVVANETRWWASKTEYLQRVPGVATFHVKDGRTVVVEPAPGSLAGDIRAYLLAPIFTSVCFQKGMYALHASSVLAGDGVVGFLGHSGAGKSTLAAALERRGFPVVSDDFCLLGPFTDDGGPLVIPVAPAVKLWRSALDHLGTAPDGLARVWSQEDKYRLRLRESSERRPLRQLYFLEWAEGAEEGPQFAPATGPEAVTRLMEMVHFEYLMKPAGRLAESFLLSARVLGRVPTFTLRRPRDFSRFGEVVDRLEERIRGGAGAGKAEDLAGRTDQG